jgi:hypothetical protein
MRQRQHNYRAELDKQMYMVKQREAGGSKAAQLREQQLLRDEERRTQEAMSKEDRDRKEKLMKEQRDAMASLNQANEMKRQ